MQKLVYPSLRNGLVAAWCPSVDRSRSTLLTDLSGYGHHGTLTNMDPGTDWVASDGKVALDVSSTSYVDITKDIDPTGSITLAGWGKPISISGNGGWILTRGYDTAGAGWSMRIGFTSAPAASGGIVANGAYTGLDDTLSVSGKWTHVVLVWIPAVGVTLYRNGQTVGSSSTSNSTLRTSTVALTIGSENGPYGENLEGLVDDIRIYNRAITPSEIALLAQRRGMAYETYRVPVVRGAVAGGVTVTPTTVALTATKFAPTVLTPQTVTPPTEVLGATGFAPTVSTPVTVTPSTTVLGASGFAPTVTATGDVTVTPITTVLGATGFIPTVSTVSGLTVTPPTTELGITTFAPLPPTQALMLQELWTLTQRLKLDVDLLFALLR